MNPSIVANSKWRYLLLLKLWNYFLKIPRIENGLNIHLTSSDPFFKRVEFPIHKSTIKLCLIKYQIHILFKTEYYQLCFLYKGDMMLQKPWRNCCNLTYQTRNNCIQGIPLWISLGMETFEIATTVSLRGFIRIWINCHFWILNLKSALLDLSPPWCAD